MTLWFMKLENGLYSDKCCSDWNSRRQTRRYVLR